MSTPILPTNMVMSCKPLKEIEGEQAYPCFPANADSEAMVETAKRWANPGYYSGTGRMQEGSTTFDYPNQPFGDVTIKSLEVRDEGGRAYKVFLKHDGKTFYVDLREGTLMDVILTKGIQAGGKLNGEYVFVQYGSQMRLVLVGSEAHTKAMETEVVRDTKRLTNKELKPGHLYESLNGDKSIFLGWIYHYEAYYGAGYKEIKWEPVKKKMLFFDVRYHYKNTEAAKIAIESSADIDYFYVNAKTTQSFRVDHGFVATFDLAKFVERVQESGIVAIKKELIENKWRNTGVGYIFRSSNIALTKDGFNDELYNLVTKTPMNRW